MGKNSCRCAWVVDKLEAEREFGTTISISLCKLKSI